MTYRDNLFKPSGANAMPTSRQSLLSQYNDEKFKRNRERAVMKFQIASKLDWEPIALLHAENWRENYRGSFSDHYLDHEVVEDRKKVWYERILNPVPNQNVIIAENEGKFCGFACTYSHYKGKNRHYLDNLHVDKKMRGNNIGAHLLQQSAQWAFSVGATSDFYLLVLVKNFKGIRFYKRHGATLSKPYIDITPEGSHLEVIECSWKTFNDIKL